MDIIKTTDFFVRKTGVWLTAVGGLLLHACTCFLANRHDNAGKKGKPNRQKNDG